MIWAAAVVVLAWVPGVGDRLAVLSCFRGRLGAALIVAGAAATLLRRRPLTSWAVGLGPRLLFAVSTTLFVAAGLHYTRGIQATGDEVEYLMLAQSLWREHDLDLEDNFARGDHLEYTAGLGEMPFGTFRRDGRPISTHSPGLPLLLAPVYALGGRAACVALLALLASWLALEVRLLALRATGSREAALGAWLACVGPPTFFYAFHVYTEVPTALGLALALRLLLGAPGPAAAAAAALAAAALPWMHVKMVLAALALGLVALARLRGRARLAFVAVAMLMAAGYAFHHWRIFGDPTPLALYGSRVPKKVKRADPRETLPGLFLDSSAGLLPNAPVFLLSLAGLGALRRFRGVAAAPGAEPAGSATPEADAAVSPVPGGEPGRAARPPDDDVTPSAVPPRDRGPSRNAARSADTTTEAVVGSHTDSACIAGPRDHLAALTAVGLAALLPLVVWQTWWAGHCPSARFMVPLVPWLAVLVAVRVAHSPTGLARWRWTLALGGLALAVFMSLHPRDHLMLNNPSEPTHVWEALAGSPEPGAQPGTTVSLARYLPRVGSGERGDRRVVLVWVGALMALLALDTLGRRHVRIDPMFRGPGLGLALLVLVGLAVDAWTPTN